MLGGEGGGCWGSRVAPCNRSVSEITEKWPTACTYAHIKRWHWCPVMPKLSRGAGTAARPSPASPGGCSPSLTLLPPRLLGTSITACSNGLRQTPSCSRAVFPICKAGRKVLPSRWGKPFALGRESGALFASLIQAIFALQAPSRGQSSAWQQERFEWWFWL